MSNGLTDLTLDELLDALETHSMAFLVGKSQGERYRARASSRDATSTRAAIHAYVQAQRQAVWEAAAKVADAETGNHWPGSPEYAAVLKTARRIRAKADELFPPPAAQETSDA